MYSNYELKIKECFISCQRLSVSKIEMVWYKRSLESKHITRNWSLVRNRQNHPLDLTKPRITCFSLEIYYFFNIQTIWLEWISIKDTFRAWEQCRLRRFFRSLWEQIGPFVNVISLGLRLDETFLSNSREIQNGLHNWSNMGSLEKGMEGVQDRKGPEQQHRYDEIRSENPLSASRARCLASEFPES